MLVARGFCPTVGEDQLSRQSSSLLSRLLRVWPRLCHYAMTQRGHIGVPNDTVTMSFRFGDLLALGVSSLECILFTVNY